MGWHAASASPFPATNDILQKGIVMENPDKNTPRCSSVLPHPLFDLFQPSLLLWRCWVSNSATVMQFNATSELTHPDLWGKKRHSHIPTMKFKLLLVTERVLHYRPLLEVHGFAYWFIGSSKNGILVESIFQNLGIDNHGDCLWTVRLPKKLSLSG